MKEKKRIKTNIKVGSAVKEKVGDMEYEAREGRIRRTRKEAVGYVQDVVSNYKFAIKLNKT